MSTKIIIEDDIHPQFSEENREASAQQNIQKLV